ncbi:Alpha/beta hydrolase fold-3 [Penicillium concentricum]|uniref:Alpha/beta hydrolase fold-3 n=1 Tax=Penicillium concentricum TaxID=293559 RepID=A0A9W9SBI8_9EURO|nr:Alpha/beta hydrolase fold-3 [Penicillium concentricum]KAJ5373153.1 Alpha/beta hydrolase fold-3 [Penicillium concentricum]
MPITSDITLNVSKFQPENVTESTKKAAALLENITTTGPRWWEVDIEKYREMRELGQTSLPRPVYLPAALDGTIPSRHAGREISIRIYKPDNGQPSKGIFLHFHGGGFVLATHKHSDSTLREYANKCQLTAISVGYRLAPEHPYPAAMHDAIDAAEYMVDHAAEVYNAPLRFIGGESAGACLAAQSALQLMRSRPSYKLSGLVLPYGLFDLSLGLPMIAASTKPLMINLEIMERFNSAYVPGMSTVELKLPCVSPLYEDLPALVAASSVGSLPPALFFCGTEDPLLDDTILMSSKWSIAGGEAIVKIYPGATHGFTAFPGLPVADEAHAVTLEFIQEKLIDSA